MNKKSVFLLGIMLSTMNFMNCAKAVEVTNFEEFINSYNDGETNSIDIRNDIISEYALVDMPYDKIINGTNESGDNYSLDGASYSGIINSSRNLTIQDLTMKNFTGTNGGAINNAGTLTISDTDFINNTADKGGAIYSTNNVTINAINKAVNFSENTAANGGSDIFMQGTSENQLTLALNAASSENKLNFSGSIEGSYSDLTINSATSGMVELTSV